VYYNYIINEYYNYSVSNKSLLEDCDKEENVKVRDASTSYWKMRL